MLRDVTERPSALEGGTVVLVGTDTDRIVRESSLLFDDEATFQRMSRVHSPYGDGHASERIANRLGIWLKHRTAGKAV
ncbi:UDP-N-acetylglucosamine 2-epimerase [compost metagenome]